MLNSKNNLKNKLIKIGLIFVLIYLIFLVGKAALENWNFNKTIGQLEEEIKVLEAENSVLKNQITYYGTDSYKERVRRERLGFKKPGEEVIVIVPGKDEAEEIKKNDKTVKLSNFKKWWYFFFPPKDA